MAFVENNGSLDKAINIAPHEEWTYLYDYGEKKVNTKKRERWIENKGKSKQNCNREKEREMIRRDEEGWNRAGRERKMKWWKLKECWFNQVDIDQESRYLVYQRISTQMNLHLTQNSPGLVDFKTIASAIYMFAKVAKLLL